MIHVGALKRWAMEKWLCWGSLGTAGILLILFILDMILEIPFGRVDITVDIIGVIACGLVGYLAWDALKELR
jgi:hypothetical protein